MVKQYTKKYIHDLLLDLEFSYTKSFRCFLFQYEYCRISIPIDINDNNIEIMNSKGFWKYTPTETMQFININFYKKLRKLKIKKLLDE